MGHTPCVCRSYWPRTMKHAFWQETPQANTQRERRKQAFRDKIIESAIELFEQKGCEATTLEDICEAAGISRPTFYSYYASKQELIQALGDKLWLRLASEMTTLSIAQHASTQQYIHSFLDMTRQQISQYNRLERELIRLNMASDPSDGNSMNILAGLTTLFMDVYKQGKKRGDIGNRFPIDFLAEMTMGSISAVMMQWAVNDDYPIDRRLKQVTDYILCTLELQK